MADQNERNEVLTEAVGEGLLGWRNFLAQEEELAERACADSTGTECLVARSRNFAEVDPIIVKFGRRIGAVSIIVSIRVSGGSVTTTRCLAIAVFFF